VPAVPTALEAHERVGGPAATRQSVLVQAVIASYTRPTPIEIPILTDISRWLFNQGRTAPGRPGDLGYFIGYRIAQAYYLKATDKAQAIRDLITLRDPAALLAQSGYAGSGPPIP